MMQATVQTTERGTSGEVMIEAQSSGAIVETRQPTAPAATIDDPIMALIRDPSIDLDRVKAILSLRREMADEDARLRREAAETEARQAFNEAFLRVQTAIPIVARDGKNTETKSQYATLARIGEKIDAIVAANGFTTSFYPLADARDAHVKLECILAHNGGHERRFQAEVPFDNVGAKGGATKTAIQGWRSATTYARRTLYELMFNVKTTPDDDGNAAGRMSPVTAKQIAEIEGLIAETSTELPKFLSGYKIEAIADLTPVQFGEARILLEQKRSKQARAAKGEATNGR